MLLFHFSKSICAKTRPPFRQTTHDLLDILRAWRYQCSCSGFVLRFTRLRTVFWFWLNNDLKIINDDWHMLPPVSCHLAYAPAPKLALAPALAPALRLIGVPGGIARGL